MKQLSVELDSIEAPTEGVLVGAPTDENNRIARARIIRGQETVISFYGPDAKDRAEAYCAGVPDSLAMPERDAASGSVVATSDDRTEAQRLCDLLNAAHEGKKAADQN